MSPKDERWSNWLATQRHVSKVVEHYEGLLRSNRIGYFIAGCVAGALVIYLGTHS